MGTKEVNDRTEPAFPRPWLDKCYLKGSDFLYAVKRIAEFHGLHPATSMDQITLGLAAQNIYPAWMLELSNRSRKRKLAPEKHILTTPEVVAWLRWYEKGFSDSAKAA
ncbi:hypothetical protein GOE07_02340 [Sinorhizobium medicae]|uniref:hypothetical protein n=1 Tax=Sinorhizobium medicae TaxID=110321 RepID=UPI000FDA49EE|nr:hypothetical protein [Sinorhizobium medicae]MDX0889755.1 hypothetical protein [Sinorhizobium medicae]RVJ82714.1 hypothetical protein CN168_10950 [Sinorhizobium medicae]